MPNNTHEKASMTLIRLQYWNAETIETCQTQDSLVYPFTPGDRKEKTTLTADIWILRR